MPNRQQQRVAKKRARRRQVVDGLRDRRIRRRVIRDEAAVLGADVARALQFFRDHDLSPERVHAALSTDRILWTFTCDADMLTVDLKTRDMLLELMENQD